MVVAKMLVEAHDVVGEMLAARGKDAGNGRVAAEEGRHVIRRASHQAEGGLRPHLGGKAAGLQVLVSARDLVAAQHRAAGLG